MRLARIVLPLALSLPLMAVAPATTTEWQIETVAAGGTFTSLQIDAYGNGHVVYFDDVHNTLKYSFRDHKLDKWFTTTLDKSGGFCAMVLDSQGRPRISYDEYGTGKIKYAAWDGAKWHTEAVQLPAKEISFYTSIALDSNDLPGMSFYEYFGPTGDNLLRLRHVDWNGSYWEARTVDSTPGSGKFNSLASDSHGNPHIAYANVKYENASLRYASWNGRSWDPEIVEGIPGTGYTAFSVYLVIDKSDVPHIAYTDVPKHLIKYATREGDKWKCEVVDSVVQQGYPDRNGLAFDENGTPYESYYDAGVGALRVAHKTDHGWVTEQLDQNYSGFTSSMKIYNGTLWIAYADQAAHVLKVAHRQLTPAELTNHAGVNSASATAGGHGMPGAKESQTRQ